MTCDHQSTQRRYLLWLLILATAGCSKDPQTRYANAVRYLQSAEAELSVRELEYEIAQEKCYAELVREKSGLDLFLLEKLHLQALDALEAESSRALRDSKALLSGQPELMSIDSKLGISHAELTNEWVSQTGADLDKAEKIVNLAKQVGTQENKLYEALVSRIPEKKKYEEQKQLIAQLKSDVAEAEARLP